MALSIVKSALSIPIGLALFLLLAYNFKIKEIFKSNELKSFIVIVAIGILVCTPWLIRNAIMFHNPFYPDVHFISTYRINEKMWKLRQEAGGNPLSDIFSFSVLRGYFSYYIFTIFIGTSYALYKWDKKTILLLSIILTGLIPELILGAKDIRYIMHLVPITVFLFCSFLKEFIPEFKYKKHFLYILILALVVLTIFEIKSGGERIMSIRNPSYGMMDAYEWLANNTLNEEYNILDLFAPRGLFLLYMFDSSNKRGVTFPHAHAGSGDTLWHFWEYPDAKQRLESCKIKYIVVQKYFFKIPKSLRRFAGWTYLPEEFVEWADRQTYMKRVFENEDILIYRVGD